MGTLAVGTLPLLGVGKKNIRNRFYSLILMFTINRTIVSQAYGSYRARSSHHVQAQGPADGHITQSTTPIPSPHQKSGNTHQLISDLLQTQNSHHIVRYHQPKKSRPKQKKQNASPLYGFLCAELVSADKMTTLRAPRAASSPQGPPPATVRQVTKSYAQLKNITPKKVRW